MKKCPQCDMLLKSQEYLLTEDGFIKVTKFYRCDICNEEYYDLNEIEKEKK